MNVALLEEEEGHLQALREKQHEAQKEIDRLWDERDNIFKHVNIMKEEAEKTAKAFYDKEMDLAQERLDRALEAISLKYQSDEEEYKQEYLNALLEICSKFLDSI